jgi:hypothetical protein
MGHPSFLGWRRVKGFLGNRRVGVVVLRCGAPGVTDGVGGTNAGGFARRASTTAEGTGVHNDSSGHAGAGNRSDYGDFYARAPGDAEVPAGIEAGGALAHRR